MRLTNYQVRRHVVAGRYSSSQRLDRQANGDPRAISHAYFKMTEFVQFSGWSHNDSITHVNRVTGRIRGSAWASLVAILEVKRSRLSRSASYSTPRHRRGRAFRRLC